MSSENMVTVGDFYGNSGGGSQNSGNNNYSEQNTSFTPVKVVINSDTPNPNNTGNNGQNNQPTPANSGAQSNNNAQNNQQPVPNQQPVTQPEQKPVPANNEPPVNVVENYFMKDGKFDTQAAIDFITKSSTTQAPVTPVKEPIPSSVPSAQAQPVSPEQTPAPKAEWEIQKEYVNYGVDAVQEFITRGYPPEQAIQMAKTALENYTLQQKNKYEIDQRFTKMQEEFKEKERLLSLKENAANNQAAFYSNMAKISSDYGFRTVGDFQNVLLNPEYGSGKAVVALFEKMNPDYKNKQGKEYQEAIGNWFTSFASDPEIANVFGMIAHARIVSHSQKQIIRQAQIEQEKITKSNSSIPITKSSTVTQGGGKTITPEQETQKKIREFFGVGGYTQSIN